MRRRIVKHCLQISAGVFRRLNVDADVDLLTFKDVYKMTSGVVWARDSEAHVGVPLRNCDPAVFFDERSLQRANLIKIIKEDIGLAIDTAARMLGCDLADIAIECGETPADQERLIWILVRRGEKDGGAAGDVQDEAAGVTKLDIARCQDLEGRDCVRVSINRSALAALAQCALSQRRLALSYQIATRLARSSAP